MSKRHYFAYGITVATDWYGNIGYAPVNLENLDDEQVQDILNDPLRIIFPLVLPK